MAEQTKEALMVWVMNRFSEVFREHAILKGGMSLRLLDSPRYTNDLDFVFVPFKSKKEIHPRILTALQGLEGAKITHNMHSTSARYLLTHQGISIQIEINVAPHCKHTPMSNASLARATNQTSRILSVMSYDWALAHKLAAWNERNLIRDLYDIYFLYSKLKEQPDLDVLKERLKKIHYQRNRKGPKSMSMNEFLNKLEGAIQELSVSQIDEELRDQLTPEERSGLHLKMKLHINTLIIDFSTRLK